jgi:hypothetical protein
MAEDSTTVSHRAGRLRKVIAVLAACVAGGIALAACSSTSSSATASSAPKLSACPQGSPAGGGAPAGAPTGGALNIPVAKTVARTDTSSSVVVNPTGRRSSAAGHR